MFCSVKNQDQMVAYSQLILLLCSSSLCWARSKPNSGDSYPSSMPEKPEFQVEFATSKNIYEDGNPLHPDPEIAEALKRDRPASPQRCFFVVASCQYKAKQGDWDKLDCVNDNKVVDCCQFECTKKQVAFQKAKEAYQKIIEGETKATLDQLQKLENQRQKILHQLKNARERVVKRLPSNDPQDFFTVASLPQQTKDELMTLAQVAEAVIHSKVHLEPEIQTDLEETIAENLVELTKEAINEQKNDVIVKSPEKVEDYNDNVYDMTSDELEDFIDDNDIMKAQDPFSKFLRKEMGI